MAASLGVQVLLLWILVSVDLQQYSVSGKEEVQLPVLPNFLNSEFPNQSHKNNYIQNEVIDIYNYDTIHHYSTISLRVACGV